MDDLDGGLKSGLRRSVERSRLTLDKMEAPKLALLLCVCALGEGRLCAEELLRVTPPEEATERLCAWPISSSGGESSKDEMLIKGILSCLSTSRREYDLESAIQAIVSRRTARVLPGSWIFYFMFSMEEH